MARTDGPFGGRPGLGRELDDTAAARGRRRWLRPMAVLSSSLAALLVATLARHGFGVALRSPSLDPGQPPQPLGVGIVAVIAALAAVAAWALLGLVERVSSRPRAVWGALALVGFLVSLGAPLSGGGVDAADRVTLLTLHVAVAGLTIPLLWASASPRRAPGRSRRAAALGG